MRAPRYLPDANWLKRAVPTVVAVSGFRASLLAIPIVAGGYLAMIAARTLLRFALCLMINPLTVEELRRQRGVCVVCEYDLTGSVSGVCPNCGTAIAGGPNRAPQAAQDASGADRAFINRAGSSKVVHGDRMF